MKKSNILVAAGLTAMMLASPAHAQWVKATTPHFVIYSEDSEKKVAKFARELESFDAAYRAANQLASPVVAEGNKLHVYMVKDTEAVHEVGGIDEDSGIRG